MESRGNGTGLNLNALREQAEANEEAEEGDDSGSEATDHYAHSDYGPGDSPDLAKGALVENPLPPPHARQLSENETISFTGYGIGAQQGKGSGGGWAHEVRTSPTQARFLGGMGGLPASPRAGAGFH